MTKVMEIGFIGLGRMGGNMVRRLTRKGHRCHIFSSSAGTRDELARESGAVAASSLSELVASLALPRRLWVMVPAGPATDAVIDELIGLCDPGDVIVDGGNSHFKQTVARARKCLEAGIDLVDCGTSGGVYGLTRGYSLMVGGQTNAVAALDSVFDALSPGIAAAPRLDLHEGAEPAPGEHGWLHCGPPGSGHYVKMIHNGIEYGMMQAMAEGFALLASAGQEALPAEHRYQLDLGAIAEVWRQGSVVSSWLLDLGAKALVEDPSLQGYSPQVADSGEGRWTIEAAIDQRVSAQVLAAALFARFDSRDDVQLGNRFLSALRHQFGGHPSLSSGS